MNPAYNAFDLPPNLGVYLGSHLLVLLPLIAGRSTGKIIGNAPGDLVSDFG